jgi:hypothetical protein
MRAEWRLGQRHHSATPVRAAMGEKRRTEGAPAPVLAAASHPRLRWHNPSSQTLPSQRTRKQPRRRTSQEPTTTAPLVQAGRTYLPSAPDLTICARRGGLSSSRPSHTGRIPDGAARSAVVLAPLPAPTARPASSHPPGQDKHTHHTQGPLPPERPVEADKTQPTPVRRRPRRRAPPPRPRGSASSRCAGPPHKEPSLPRRGSPPPTGEAPRHLHMSKIQGPAAAGTARALPGG